MHLQQLLGQIEVHSKDDIIGRSYVSLKQKKRIRVAVFCIDIYIYIYCFQLITFIGLLDYGRS